MSNSVTPKNFAFGEANAQDQSVKPPVGNATSVKPPVGQLESVKPPLEDSAGSVKPPVGQ
jgi:hypothetical protein